nr:Ferrichrome receptor FcuA precursor [Klebsiella pneumoniae]
MAKAEYDLTDSWTVYSALGGQHSHEIGTYSAPKLLNKTAMRRWAAGY